MSHAPSTLSSGGPSAAERSPVQPAAPQESLSFGEILDSVCRRVAPVWPLADYVAVNPYMGYTDQEFLATSRRLQGFSDCQMLMPLAYYQQRHSEGAFDRSAIELAIDELVEAGLPGAELLSARQLLGLLEREDEGDSAHASTAWRSHHSASAAYDSIHQTDWTPTIHDEVGKHCAAYYDEGQATWLNPWKGQSLYTAWRSAMRFDRAIEVQGLTGARAFVKRLPVQPEEAVESLLHQLGVPQEEWENYLLCLAYELPGWCAWAQYRSRWVENGQAKAGDGAGSDLIDLLAVRLAYDGMLVAGFDFEPVWPSAAAASTVGVQTQSSAVSATDVAIYALHRANEIGFRDRLLTDLQTKGAGQRTGCATGESCRKLAQLAFCIDVRSERIRRHLESTDTGVETLGFAGFFGLPIRVTQLGEKHATNQLPVLVPPKIDVHEQIRDAAPEEAQHAIDSKSLIRSARKAWKAFQGSAVSMFAFVETTGLWFGVKLAMRTLGIASASKPSRLDGVPVGLQHRLGPGLSSLRESGMSVADLADLAAGILGGMGLTREFSRLVVFCGHGCQTENNPLKAGLDCGACGGHSGEPNARLAAQLMNDAEVREALKSRGVNVPADTHFLAALHNTTTDVITILDDDLLPETHVDDLRNLNSLLLDASGKTRTERSPLVSSSTEQDLFRRARDWSEVRPEWGLAGNAAFIAGPRPLTAAVDLQGRAFLHNYDHHRDPEGKVLETILTAPMVVASWINLQYFASTVDQRHFGSGKKTIHNVVGRFGALAGNGGDLTTGLPWESIHDGRAHRHEPLRLLSVVAAPRAMIGGILDRHTDVRDLATNGWIHLVAYDDGGFHRFTPNATWEPIASPTGEATPRKRDHALSHANA